MTTRLYYHKTDGGAEYLCLNPVPGTDEGDLRFAIIRLDGRPEFTEGMYHHGMYNRIVALEYALEKLLCEAERQLDQSATHDGLENCNLLAEVRGIFAGEESTKRPTDEQIKQEIYEWVDSLDGNGLVITDDELINDALKNSNVDSIRELFQ